MPLPELKELRRAEQFFDAGKLNEALNIFNEESLFDGLDLQQKTYFHFLKGLLLLYLYESDEAINLGEKMYREGQKQNANVQSFDGLFFIIEGFILVKKFEEALKKIDKAENILKLISDRPKNVFVQRSVRLDLLKAVINLETGNIEKAEKYLEKIFDSEKDLGSTVELVWANMLMAEMLLGKSRFDLAMEYTKKMLSIAKEIRFNHYWIAVSHGYFGLIFSFMGELDSSLKHYKKALKIFKKFKSNFLIATVLNNIGNVHAELGDYEIALKYLEESLKFWKQDPVQVESCIDSIIAVAYKKGDTDLIQKYFQRLENMYKQTPDSHIELIYYYNKALILKGSPRIRDKAKAEKLFKRVIKTETLHSDIIINAYIHLCDLLLEEFRMNKNDEVLEEINQNIAQLLAIAERSHSYLIFCETFILQAKLALIKFNIKAARRLLTKAQKIAENYGIKRLAIKISCEHDELLKQIEIWEKLKKSDISLSERWKLVGMNEQMKNMVGRHAIDIPELSEEEPVLIYIITEGGKPLFSHSFVEEKPIDSKIFSGILSTINYFIKEMFSEGLDRAMFGEYTLLMKSIPPFYICYIFKGDSYYAHQKIKYFMDQVQKEEVIWQNLLDFFQINQLINLNDLPLLKSLIRETFIIKRNIYTRS